MADDCTEGAAGCVRAMVAAVEAWLVAKPSGSRCQVACRCSRGAAAAHDRPPTLTALDAHFITRDYQSSPTDHWGEVCALGWLPWWEPVITALSAHRSTFKSQGRIRGRIGPDKADSYQKIVHATDQTQGLVSTFTCTPDTPWRCVTGLERRHRTRGL